VIARRLPATAATATTAAATAAVATATAATATRTTTTATSAGLVLGFIDAQRTAAHRVTIQRLDCARGISLRHFHEAESTRATRFPVSRKRNGLHRAMLREQRAHCSLIRRKREVAYVNLRHEYRSPKKLQNSPGSETNPQPDDQRSAGILYGEIAPELALFAIVNPRKAPQARPEGLPGSIFAPPTDCCRGWIYDGMWKTRSAFW
jgi:hypothetical protein